MGTDAPIGTSAQVLDVAPGALSVSCADPDSQDEPPSATLELIDDDGVWVSPQLGPGCRSGSDAVLDYAVGAEGEQGDPVEVARRFFAARGARPPCRRRRGARRLSRARRGRRPRRP
jgi:hypothetical protein